MAAVTIIAGCTPPGPRALLNGKELIDKGQYAAAVEELRLATKLMGTNALAWNYLGLACHHAGLGAEAATAYQRAQVLDRDLSEAHFNLGCLWLEENRLEGAKAEFLAFTLRRGNSVEGLAKLGAVQLQLREISGAEKSFGDVLKLSTNNVEALTGLGLARVQRGRPVEAAQYFNAALRADPGYRPALLNLAIVAQQQLHDRPLALQKYRDYLGLQPAPADADAVRSVIRQLEQESPPAAQQQTNSPVAQVVPVKITIPTGGPPATNTASRSASVHKPESVVTNLPKPAPTTAKAEPVSSGNEKKPQASPVARPQVASPPKPVTPVAEPKTEVVELASVPVPKTGEDIVIPRARPATPSGAEARAPSTSQESAAGTNQPKNKTLVQKIFGGGGSAGARTNNPATASAPAVLAPASGSPEKKAWARYVYRNPGKPAKGDTAAAQRAFAQGLQAHQANHLPEAIQAYRAAVQSDPLFFDAQYHLGVAGTQSGNLRLALGAYESALAAKPDSADARYNFAIVLKQSGYPVDAANELQTLLAKYPTDARAHVALGNLYAQQLGDTAKARQHYLRVLETDPRHPQAAQIRYWLADNPK